MAAIVARGVTKVYTTRDGSERVALNGIDLEVTDGEFMCLLGPSGCGKTTLLNVLSGLDAADAGTITIEASAAAPAQASPVLSYMFQEARLLPWLTVSENLAFVLDGPARRNDDLIRHWLAKVGLSGRERDYPRHLSIGQQQRVAVARALCIRPDVLFMDEPFSSLDELTATMMRGELLDLWTESGATVLFVTHNPVEAAFLADRIVVMAGEPGRIVETTDVRASLVRPRDPNDTRLWEASRRAVAALEHA